jgi:hypothetical protein
LTFERYARFSPKAPKTIQGEVVRMSMTIPPELRRLLSDRLRPLLEPCELSRLTVFSNGILVEGLSESEATRIEAALVQIQRELNLETRPVRITHVTENSLAAVPEV